MVIAKILCYYIIIAHNAAMIEEFSVKNINIILQPISTLYTNILRNDPKEAIFRQIKLYTYICLCISYSTFSKTISFVPFAWYISLIFQNQIEVFIPESSFSKY